LKVLILLSGGVDSCVLVGSALKDGHQVGALSFQYGAKHERPEMQAARRIAEHYGVERAVIDLRDAFYDIRKASSLTGGGGPTYVPGRNAILLSVAVGVAEAREFEQVWYGANMDDHADFPDCRPEFFRAFSNVARLGTQSGVEVHAPFGERIKSSVVRLGCDIDAPLHLTYTCYEGTSPACGTCQACRTRRTAFHRALKIDPALYEAVA
jgi:7-cyano-7-deazaguanine synthase